MKINFRKGKTYEDIYGIEKTKKIKEKMSLSHLGHLISEDIKIKLSLKNKGKPPTLSSFKKEHKNSEESKRKMSETRKRLYKEGKLKIWNKELTKETDERLKIQSEKRKGIIFSESWKQNLSKSLSGNKPWTQDKKIDFNKYPNFGMKGKHHTEEARLKISNKNKINRLNQVFPTKDTLPERLIQDKLKLANIQFRTHEPIIGQPDIFIEPNICIFVDGCYWHSCPNCFDRNNLNEKQHKAIIRDVLVTRRLVEQNYIVLRLWEHDIKKNIEECIDKVLFLLQDKNLILNKIGRNE